MFMRRPTCLHDEFNGARNISHLHPPFMMMQSWRPRRSVAAMLLVGAAVLGADQARAADSIPADNASPWDGDARSALLKPGWHTYWRYPGDAGVPPRFDFAGSQNIKGVEVLWPAPRRLPEAGLDTIGYDRDVILPLRVTPQDEAKPVRLQIKVGYAICEKLCVPADSKAELALTGGPGAQDLALAAAEARVPRKAELGAAAALAVRSIRREDGGGRPRVVVDMAVPAGASVDLFAEGPTPEWSLPLPAPINGAPVGLQRFAFELDGAPPGVKYEGAMISLTAVTDGGAIEVPVHLD
jgi:DsbC/DsbD-like thiol-disulfide interchange protein